MVTLLSEGAYDRSLCVCLYLLSAVTLPRSLSEGAYNRSLHAVCTYSPRSLCFQKVHTTDPCMLSVPTLRHSAFTLLVLSVPTSVVTLLSEGAYNRSLRAVCTYSPRSLCFQKVHITDPCVLSVPTLRGHSSFRRCI